MRASCLNCHMPISIQRLLRLPKNVLTFSSRTRKSQGIERKKINKLGWRRKNQFNCDRLNFVSFQLCQFLWELENKRVTGSNGDFYRIIYSRYEMNKHLKIDRSILLSGRTNHHLGSNFARANVSANRSRSTSSFYITSMRRQTL